MTWKIAEAKQHLSDVIRRASHEPQVICNRDQPVAAVIGAGELAQFMAWKTTQAKPPLAHALARLQRLCEENGYSLDLPARTDRENPVLKRKPRAPRRHQRHQ